MSDHDTISPETDDEIRARLEAFAEDVKGRTDTEAALERMPRRSRPPTIRLLAIAACFVLAVAIAAVVVADRQSVDTVPANAPTTECPNTTQPRAIPSGGQMKTRFAAPIASAATAILLLGACGDDDASASDDGPTTLAKGDVGFVGSQGLGDNRMEILAEEKDGEVTGEARFNEIVVSFECADTDTDGLVILGGEVTTPSSDNSPAVGELMAVVIREGDPDSVNPWFDDPASPAASCDELLGSIPADLPESDFTDVEDGDDIETG
jgi:hypothetical protein